MMQSGYRKFHSTETSLIRLFNDFGLSLDKSNNAVLILFDLSSAFEIIEHNILLERLKMRFCLRQCA